MKDFKYLKYQRTEYAKRIRKDYEAHRLSEADATCVSIQ